MSERLTEAEFRRLDNSEHRIWREAVRARAEEFRLREESETKDATIKTLADVLEALEHRATTHYTSSPGHHEIIINNGERAWIRKVLREVGRLT